MTKLYLGVDVGSTTVKVAGFDAAKGGLLVSHYRRHNAYQAETVHTLLAEVFKSFPGAEFRAAVCGSGGKTIAGLLGAPYIQEVVAASLAVRNFYPQARVAIELGGQDAKIVFFHHDEATNRLVAQDMRMNGSCAGGTGAFIDEVASLLKVPVEEFEGLAARGSFVYDISGRCGVFAKTDIQPLLNQGCLREDIALSTFHAIARQTIGGLAQGLELKPPIIFIGGPLTFNPTLIRVFAGRLNLAEADIIRPQNPETLVAYGAALSLDEMFSHYPARFTPETALAALASFRENARLNSGAGRDGLLVEGLSIEGLPETRKKAYFSSAEERREFEARHRSPPPPRCGAKRGDTLRVYLGIDAGSTTTKFVLLDEGENVVDEFYQSNKGEPLIVIKKALIGLNKKYREAGIRLEIIAVGVTGYGEHLFYKALGADYHSVETVAHAASAQKYVPDVSFILDIGGQDMKAISIAAGIVTNITLNEACSSGCGSFLENFASTLNIPVEDIARAAFNAKNPAELGSRCTVFMNSCIITEQKNGKEADDIMAGLCRSIIENVFTKVVRISNFSVLGERIVVQGGTFKNDAVLRALEQYSGKDIIRAPYPGVMGAIGIALLTKKHAAASGAGKSRFIGLDAMEDFSYTQQTNSICPFCVNRCNRTLVTFSNGTTWVTGNRCYRGEITGSAADAAVREKVRQITAKMEATPDLFKKREKLLFRDYPVTPLLPSSRPLTIGLPRALDFWGTMPFWTTFFHALGLKTKLSAPSSRRLFEEGLPFVASDTVCFPAKLAHGHIRSLAESGVDRIFMPMVNRVPSENTCPESGFVCSVVKGYPLVVKYSDDPERRRGIPFDTPMFHWFQAADKSRQLEAYMKTTFGITKRLTGKAVRQGEAALAAFKAELVAEGARVIAGVEKSPRFAVVLAARHYQNDELVNHDLPRYFTNMGIPVLTLDSLPGINEVDLSRTRIEITNNSHARLLSGAILAAQNPALEYVQIVSFGCGHDALLSDEIVRLMAEISGKSPLILKLDESDVRGPIHIRVKSFIETVKSRREKEGSSPPRPLTEPFPVKFVKADKKTRTILVPNVSPAFSKILSAAAARQGFKVEPLPLGGRDAIKLGKKYVHNDICFPAQMSIGEALSALQSGKYQTDEVAISMAKFHCDCRLTNYGVLLRKALDEAGFPGVPVVTTDVSDTKNMHPGFMLGAPFFIRASWALVMTDILEDILRKIRPYELEHGAANRVFNEGVAAITENLRSGGVRAAIGAYRRAFDALSAVRYDKSRPRQRVFVTGEYLLNFHAGSNFYVEEYLEKNNMEVILPRMYDVFRKYLLFTLSEVKDFHVRHSAADFLSSFAGDKLFDAALDLLEKTACRHPLYKPCTRLPELAKMSDSVLHHSFNSGETYLIPADILHYASEGVRSFVILQPFGCLPNHICGRGVIKRVKEAYPGIQILPLDYDPDTSFANIENRLQMLIMNARNFEKPVSEEKKAAMEHILS
jgi:predicted CoA-substrate-specific enzyme activase